MTEGARPAGPGDVERVRELVARAQAELAGVRGGPQALADRPFAAEQLLEGPARALWVGFIDSHVVGFAGATVRRLPEGTGRGLIDALYVEPEARGVSVGEALLTSAAAWLTQQGCSSLDAWALPGDAATKAAFESAGFKARLLVMNRES